LFFSEHDDAYVACFRPVKTCRDSADRYACRYLNIEIAEVREMTKIGLLPGSLANVIDEELHELEPKQ
jgi:hypothetical protein